MEGLFGTTTVRESDTTSIQLRHQGSEEPKQTSFCLNKSAATRFESSAWRQCHLTLPHPSPRPPDPKSKKKTIKVKDRGPTFKDRGPRTQDEPGRARTTQDDPGPRTQDVSMVSMASVLQISNNEQHCQAVQRMSYHVLSTLEEPNFKKN